jgi:hypothetical protein
MLSACGRRDVTCRWLSPCGRPCSLATPYSIRSSGSASIAVAWRDSTPLVCVPWDGSPGELLATWSLPASRGAPDIHANDEWIQIESENFVITTDGSEKSGRRIAQELETVRVVFRIAIRGFPNGAPPPLQTILSAPSRLRSQRAPAAMRTRRSRRSSALFSSNRPWS